MMLFEYKSAGHYRQPASDRCDGLFVGDLRGTRINICVIVPLYVLVC